MKICCNYFLDLYKWTLWEDFFHSEKKSWRWVQKINRLFSCMFWNIPKFRAQNQAPRTKSAPSVVIFFLFMIRETRFNQQLPAAGSVKWFLKPPKWAIFQKQPIKNGKNQAPPTPLSYCKRRQNRAKRSKFKNPSRLSVYFDMSSK